MRSDIEIAESVQLKPIKEVAESLGVKEDEFYPIGKYMAKLENVSGGKSGKLILVTAINPTSSGEGKTTISIGLADGLKKLNQNVCLALREPSLGPVFGIKGGATGGGFAQIAPMDDINLHFTGDMHAITSANNLLSALIDNHIYWGNKLNIKTVTWRRCLDVNDRALRNVVCGLGLGITREDTFDITAASEIMAILCLSRDLTDLKQRLNDIVIGEDKDGKLVKASDLKAADAMAILLKEAIKPNLAQTLEGAPALVHGGPFANIAHGCNSVIATKMALSLADYVVTEAGFGADLGAEKFLDIKCRTAEIKPNCVVIVATIKALKCAGGMTGDLKKTDNAALKAGFGNLEKHIENITKVYKLPCVVAINKFITDSDEEINLVTEACEKLGATVATAEVWAKGGEGAIQLAKKVMAAANTKSELQFAYELSESVEDKICAIATKIYGASNVVFSVKAKKAIAKIVENNMGGLPVCIAKTQYSLSDNPALIGRPKDFSITVKDVYFRAGARFIVAVAGDILLMPGLSKTPNAENMTYNNGVIRGLF